MTVHAVPDRAEAESTDLRVRTLLGANREITRQRDLLMGLLVERLVADEADRHGGVEALDPRSHQRLIDQKRDELRELVVGDARAEELIRVGRGTG